MPKQNCNQDNWNKKKTILENLLANEAENALNLPSQEEIQARVRKLGIPLNMEDESKTNSEARNFYELTRRLNEQTRQEDQRVNRDLNTVAGHAGRGNLMQALTHGVKSLFKRT